MSAGGARAGGRTPAGGGARAWTRAWAAASAALALGCPAKRPASLAEAIGVEQPGGTVSQLVAQGSELPTSATESFTTATNGETRLYLHVVRGGGKVADKPKTESFWQLDGVRPAKAGEARVVVTFELDGNGRLAVSAREDDRRLQVKKVDAPAAQGALAPLTEPDDDDDTGDDDPE